MGQFQGLFGEKPVGPVKPQQSQFGGLFSAPKESISPRGNPAQTTPAPVQEAPQQKEKKWYETALDLGKAVLSPITEPLSNTKFFREAGAGMEAEKEERDQVKQQIATATQNGDKQALEAATAKLKTLPPENFGARLTKTVFEKSTSALKAVAEPLANTKFFKEAAAGLEAVKSGEVQGSTLDYLGEDLLKNTQEFAKTLPGNYVANALDLIIASPTNFATRAIFGKSNPIGDFFAGAADQIRSEIETDRSKAISEQKFGVDKLSNPDYWLIELPSQLTSTLVFMGVAGKVFKGTTAALGKVLGSSKFAQVATTIAAPLVAGTIQRTMESSSEAESTYKDAKNQGMSEEAAVAAAKEVFKKNMLLTGLDAAQIAAAYLPFAKGGSLLSKIMKETAAFGFGAASEGGEELLQYHFQENATGNKQSLADRFKDPKAQEAMFVGAAMGLLFEGGGRITEREQEKYMDEVAKNLPTTIQQSYNKATNFEQKQAVLDRAAVTNQKEVEQAVLDYEKETREAADSARQVIDTVRSIPTAEQVRDELNSGKSPSQVALELSSKIGTEEAQIVVDEVIANSIQEDRPVSRETKAAPAEPKTALEDTNKQLTAINDKLLESTPSDLQAEFTKTQEEFDSRMDTVESEIKDLREQISNAKDNSPQKKELKKQLSEKIGEFKKANEELTSNMVGQAQQLRKTLETYIPENFDVKLTPQQLSDVIDSVADQITDPDAIQKSGNTPIGQIVAEQVQALQSNKVKQPKTPVKPAKKEDTKPLPKSTKEEKSSRKTFVSEENAKQYADELKAKGIKSKLLKEKVGAKAFIYSVTIDKQAIKQDTKPNDKPNENSGNRDRAREVSKPTPDSQEQPGGAGSTTEVDSKGKRGQRPAKRGDNIGKRSGTRLSNEEIAEVVSRVATINKSADSKTNGLVLLTHEVTEDVLEAANQYQTGGTEKMGRGVLDEYYTNSKIVDLVKSLFDFSAQPLKVLEPAVGTGNFIYALPDMATHDITAHEINETTAKIAKIFHQNAKVYNTSFETTFIDERGKAKDFVSDYDLVIGNPPYGDHRGKYLGLGEEKKIGKYEEYFIKRGLDVLKDGGKLAMVVPSGFLRGGNSFAKQEIAKLGTLVNAFRLPNGVFEGTDVGTDIVIFEKRAGDVSLLQDDIFFTENPKNILGEQKTRKGKFGEEPFVEGDLDTAIATFYEKHNEREAIKVLQDLGLPETIENIETAEDAIEEAGSEAKSLVTQAKKQGEKTIEKKIVKKSAKTDKPISLISQFENQFSEEELELWKQTQQDGSIKGENPNPELTNYFNGKWYLDFNYLQGDIYEKLEVLEKEKSNIPTAQYKRQKEKLESVKPRRETIDDLKLSPNISFVKDLAIGKDEEGKDITLRSAFLDWLTDIPSKAFGQSSRWEVSEYVRDEQVRGSDKDRNELIRGRRKVAADSLFEKFLKDGLTNDERAIVEEEYNRTFNFYHTPDYKKVPMFSEIHATFRGSPLTIRDVQKHGIGRLVNNGVGLLAHDVGFGKTMSGVLAIGETMHRGWAKRPLIVAPNENVYRQWASTIEDLIPNARLNLLGNLGAGYKGDLSSLQISDGSISIVTYEGFKRLGFNDGTYEKFGSKFGYIADDLAKHKSQRDAEKAKQEEAKQGGAMKKGTRADLSFEDLGFDHLTFDEVHNANHIVSKVKMPQGKASEFNRFSLRPSDLGIKTWLAAQYIQEQNNGRNVNLLSATPFTNHPLEYYSILSLIADKSLARMGLSNVNDFFGTFMEAENEYEFKADGTYQRKTDIRRFRNFRQFRKLLDSYIDFKEGDAEGIVRPNRVQQTYEIPQNDLGLEMETKAQEIFKEDERKEGQGAKVLRAITELRKIAFSPYASKFSPDITPEQYKEFVENSPKIKTLMELIKQNKTDKPEAGQIVYVDQVGVQFLPLMRQYMVKELGYAPSEVEIISGATDKSKRVDIQDRYNAGEIKIVLGSEAIKEGMNLQVNTSDLYILSLPWNFTQLRQVIGRAWRQGNMWGNVRVNNLFIQDSIDIFLSQKLDNKQKRYEAAIKSGENEVDVGDVSFDQMKFDLIRDPKTRAKLELQAEQEKITQEIGQQQAELSFATRKADKLQEIADKIIYTQEDLEEAKATRDEKLKNGEEASDYWVESYTDRLARLKKEQVEEITKLKEKGIDVEKLTKISEAGQAKIAELKNKQEQLTTNAEIREAEIAASMPQRKPFSSDIVSSFVADRANQNKTFYQLKAESVNTTITARETVKEIKNADGTKVVKTKKATQAVRSGQKREMVDAVRYLTDLKERLNLDFDVHFVDTILIGKPIDEQQRRWGRIEASGVTADNTIAIARDLSKATAEHESVHLTLANVDNIPVFQKQGITRNAVMEAKAAQMGMEFNASTDTQIEEQLAEDFENYMESKHEPRGIVRRFFVTLRQLIIRFARAINLTNGDIIKDYFDVLSEGRAVNEELTRLENEGIIDSMIENGVLDIESDAATKILTDRRAIDNLTKDEMIQAMDYIRLKQPYNQTIEENIGHLVEKFEITDKSLAKIADHFENLVENTKTFDISGREVFAPRFKVKEEHDARIRKLKEKYNDLAEKSETLDNDTLIWKTELEQKFAKKQVVKNEIVATPTNVKKAARFTNRVKQPVGELTKRGEAEAPALGFSSPQQAQEEVTAYLKRKLELVETKNKLRQLRNDIAQAKREGKDTAKAMRDVERRLRLRKRLLEQKDFYVGMGVNRGKQEQLRMISQRSRAIRSAQDFFGIGDKRAKDIIANRRIHLMTESEFNNFLIEFANKAEEMRSRIDAQDSIDALIQDKDFHKVDNLRLAMGLPAVSKMTPAQADSFISTLSKYQFGDTFLTQRQLETIHRTNWGDIKTERELLDKLKEQTGTGREEMATLTAPPEAGYYMPWIMLARSHPFYNWLVGKRVEAAVKAEREFVNIEEEVNKLANTARSSRRKKMTAKEVAIELIVPTDDLVFNYMEAENKEEFATKNGMTTEELDFARYLINLYHGAYEYMTGEYGMNGRQNYMTHVRRSFIEALKESGVKTAFREMFSSQREDEAAFKILDEETGETIAFEKFFGFALRRSGALVPSKNVARASLAYFNAFAKKKAMDEFVPEALIAVQAHKAVTGTTAKGLTKDPSLERFVKRFLNDAKGRKVWFGTKQGSRIDIAMRAAMTWVAIKYLGLNIASAVANFIGDYTSIFWELSTKEFGRGIVRSLNLPKAHQINKEFRFFTGRNPITELFDPKYNLPSRTLKALMSFMALGAFQSNKFFLRSKMTEEEWQKGIVDDKRLVAIAQSLSRVKPNAFYVNSLAGNTTVGKVTAQFGGWAFAIFNTVASDANEVIKMLKDKQGWEAIKSDEAMKLGKFALMGGLALLFMQMIEPPDDDDKGLIAQVIRKARRELTTLFQALDFVSNPANYAIVLREIIAIMNMVKQLVSNETYTRDGDGYAMGDKKWAKSFERIVTPTILKNFQNNERVDSREVMIDRAIAENNFNPEEIMKKYYAEQLTLRKGDELEAYKKMKIGELTVQYNLRKKYPNSRIGGILNETQDNGIRVDKIIEYGKEVGADKAWDEFNTLYRDRELCANSKNKTGCLISDSLFKAYRKAR